VDAVYRDFGKPTAAPVRTVTPAQARTLNVPAGSMGPKVTAACDFADTGAISGIGRLEDALAILEARAGTLITGSATHNG
jgi:carbamate kinase